jgi:hypothetical protein
MACGSPLNQYNQLALFSVQSDFTILPFGVTVKSED